MSQLATELRAAVAAQLQAASEFLGPVSIPVYTEDVSDMNTLIDRQLKKTGMTCTVLTPRILPGDKHLVLQVEIAVLVNEIVGVNQRAGGTTQPAVDVALAVLANLWDWTPETELANWTALRAQSCELTNIEPDVEYEVRLLTSTRVSIDR